MDSKQIKTSEQIRKVGVAEGISYLVLLIVAMPLKYMLGIPEPVKIIGWLHGVLFILFMGMILLGRFRLNWSFGRMVLAFVMSLVPFGTFWLDRKLQKEEQRTL